MTKKLIYLPDPTIKFYYIYTADSHLFTVYSELELDFSVLSGLKEVAKELTDSSAEKAYDKLAGIFTEGKEFIYLEGVINRIELFEVINV